MTTAYPLAWPEGWPRAKRAAVSRFNVRPQQATRELVREIERMGGRLVVISTNVPLRRDGLPYSSYGPDNGDHGVAVYFERKGKRMVFACDRWNTIQDNMRAIQKSIEALRGIERWGASDMLERAFTGFTALPPPKSPWETLGIPPGSSKDTVTDAYRRKAAEAHPDRPTGSHAAMAELNAARDAALAGASP